MIGLRAFTRSTFLQKKTLKGSYKNKSRSFSNRENQSNGRIGVPTRFLITVGTLTLGITAINYQLLVGENKEFLKVFHSIVPEPHASEYLIELKKLYSSINQDLESVETALNSSRKALSHSYDQLLKSIQGFTLYMNNMSEALSKFFSNGIDSVKKMQTEMTQSLDTMQKSINDWYGQVRVTAKKSLNSITSFYISAEEFTRKSINSIENFYLSSSNYILNTYNGFMYWIHNLLNPGSIKPPPIDLKKVPFKVEEKKEIVIEHKNHESDVSENLVVKHSEEKVQSKVSSEDELEKVTDDKDQDKNEEGLQDLISISETDTVQDFSEKTLGNEKELVDVKVSPVLPKDNENNVPAVVSVAENEETSILGESMPNEVPVEANLVVEDYVPENTENLTAPASNVTDLPPLDIVKTEAKVNDTSSETHQVDQSAPYVPLVDSFVVPERDLLVPSLKTTMSELASQIHSMSDSVKEDDLLKESLNNASVNLLNMVGILDYLEADQVSILMNSLHDQASQFYKEISALKKNQEQSLAEVVVTMSEAAIDAQTTLEKKHQKELAERVESLTETFLKRLEDGLRTQALEIDAFWKEHVKQVLDNERHGRLARLDSLALHIKALDTEYIKSVDYLNTTTTANILQTLIHPLSEALNNGSSEKAIAIWKKLGSVVKNSNDELVKTVYQSISPKDLMKFKSSDTLVSHFSNEVAPRAKQAIFVPNKCGIISYMIATAMSYFIIPATIFSQPTIRDGKTNEIKLHNALVHASKGDLELCVRTSVGENGLAPSWSRYILQDWALEAWETLRILKAIELLRVWTVISSVTEK